MTPIVIEPRIQAMSLHDLREKLHYKSYTFCVNADFNNIEATNELVTSLEMYAMEGLMRILTDKLDYIPLQNKIYEKIEYVFENQDAYNINRMMSSLRRAKIMPLDATDEKYNGWFKNRVKYGIKALREQLKKIDYSVIDEMVICDA